jgi:large subunit ribosomal protein L20
MPRSTNNVASRRRRKNVLASAKGYWGRRSKIYTVAKHTVDRAMRYAYRDRRQRKRHFRRLWIARINAAARLNGTSYSRMMGNLNKSDVALNRKVLADLAMNDPKAFTKVLEHVSS